MTDETIAPKNGRWLQLRKANAREWTQAKRAMFLDYLAVTCNVHASADAVGMSTTGVYMLRRRDPVFAELWRSALLAGYDHLEERLLRHAGAGINDVPIGETDLVEAELNVDAARDLLGKHRAILKGEQRGNHGGRIQRMTRAQAEKALLARLDGLAKRLRAKEAPVPEGAAASGAPGGAGADAAEPGARQA